MFIKYPDEDKLLYLECSGKFLILKETIEESM